MTVEARAPARPICSLGLLEKVRMKTTTPTTPAPPHVACCANGSCIATICNQAMHHTPPTTNQPTGQWSAAQSNNIERAEAPERGGTRSDSLATEK